jgi:branched-chain amino acid transport system permease protein
VAVSARAFADPAGFRGEFIPGPSGRTARGVVSLLIVAGAVVLPMALGKTWANRLGLAAIYAIIGLSVNIITGYAGQISLGHQAFVGMGAFMSAFVVAHSGAGFAVAVVAAGITGALAASILGLAALRIRGLYLALITLAFGLMAQSTLFNLRGFTGGGAGVPAPRPSLFQSDLAYTYLCMGVLALVLFVDWRLARSKAGRAIVALRNDERVAATLGVGVTAYKLLAFVTGGFVAGVAGALFAHWIQYLQSAAFDIFVALVWIIMAVVGGLGSRAGVVIGSAFFAVFPFLLPANTIHLPVVGTVIVQVLSPLLGAFLLLLTLTLYPGGIGQQLLPVRRWLAGGPLIEHRPKGGAGPDGDVLAEDAPAALQTARPDLEPTIELPAVRPPEPASVLPSVDEIAP